MATLTHGWTFGATELVTNAKLHALVDSATITGIIGTEISSLASLSGSQIRANTITEANLNISNAPTTQWVMGYDGSALKWYAQQSLLSILADDFANNSIKYNHLYSGASLMGMQMRDNTITEAKLNVANGATTDYVLSYNGSALNWKAQQSLLSITAQIPDNSITYRDISSLASLVGMSLRDGTVAEAKLDISNNAVTSYVMSYDGSKMKWLAQQSLLSIASGTTTATDGEIAFIIDGGGDTITTGIKGDLEIPFNCRIDRVTMLANCTGMAQVDIWADTYANYPPTSADRIALPRPSFNQTIKYQTASLGSYNISLAAGKIVRFNLDSLLSISRLGIYLKVTK